MGLYYIFTVDGDWDEYFYSKLSNSARQPNKKTLLAMIKREIRVAASINNRLLHFIHTSPVTPDFFLQSEFISLWREIRARGGNVGIHCHTEDLFHEGRFSDLEKMKKSISSLTESLVSKEINPISYRGGYMAFCEKNIPILEKTGSCLIFPATPAAISGLRES